MTICPQCHGEDGMHGLDCGFATVRPHVSHFDDCGCLSRRYQKRIDNLIADRRLLQERLAEAEEANEGLLLKITDLMRERNEATAMLDEAALDHVLDNEAGFDTDDATLLQRKDWYLADLRRQLVDKRGTT